MRRKYERKHRYSFENGDLVKNEKTGKVGTWKKMIVFFPDGTADMNPYDKGKNYILVESLKQRMLNIQNNRRYLTVNAYSELFDISRAVLMRNLENGNGAKIGAVKIVDAGDQYIWAIPNVRPESWVEPPTTREDKMRTRFKGDSFSFKEAKIYLGYNCGSFLKELVEKNILVRDGKKYRFKE